MKNESKYSLSKDISKTTKYRAYSTFENSLKPTLNFFAQSAVTVEYTDCFSAEGLDSPSKSVLDMTLNNLMMSFQ